MDAQLLNAKVIWKIYADETKEGSKDLEKLKANFPYYIPMEIIRLTLERLEEKKENRSKLVQDVKEVLEDTRENVKKLTKSISKL